MFACLGEINGFGGSAFFKMMMNIDAKICKNRFPNKLKLPWARDDVVWIVDGSVDQKRRVTAIPF